MFLRFTKGQFNSDKVRLYRKCVFLNNALVMEYGDKIVGVAELQEETEKSKTYRIVVAKRCELGEEKIARYIKDMIGKSNKFTQDPSTKRRKYSVVNIDSDVLPVKAKIELSMVN